MAAVFLTGGIGILSIIYYGHVKWSASLPFLLGMIVLGNVLAFFDILILVRGQYVAWFKKWITPTISRTWVFLCLFYLVPICAIKPSELTWSQYSFLIFCLTFASLFSSYPFGIIQDRLMKKSQREKKRS